MKVMGLPSRTIAVQYIKDMFLNSMPYQEHRNIEMLLSLKIVLKSWGRWLSNNFSIFKYTNYGGADTLNYR
jgi:hypothetical protein